MLQRDYKEPMNNLKNVQEELIHSAGVHRPHTGIIRVLQLDVQFLV